eukprot:jgi/Phyca11/109086/e_gw1.16.757.1
MYRLFCRSFGVIGPFRSEHMTPPTRSIGEWLPVSLLDWRFFDCFPCAQVRQFTRLRSVSLIPELTSFAKRSTAS